MLTGEYLVLKGASSIALASRFGQRMWVFEDRLWEGEPVLIWQAMDRRNDIWFEVTFGLPDLRIIQTSDITVALELAMILESARQLSPEFLSWPVKYRVENVLEFERHWGLGSSSTLIANIAAWAGADAFKLYRAVSNGSGYDLAVAIQNRHLQYQLKEGKPQIDAVQWNPGFADDLFFVALGNKQKSSAEVNRFNQLDDHSQACAALNEINSAMLEVDELSSFESLLKEHEAIVSEAIDKPSIQSQLFPDYPGAVKSLGAWGGDLLLASRIGEGINYFYEKGYSEIIPYRELVKAS